jgi:hypothetical protein
MAREPRVMTESTQDFADFIRSTGPPREQDVKPILNPSNVSSTSLHSLRSAHINGASRASSVASQDRTRSMTKSSMAAERVPPVPPMPTKSAMQPRAATSSGEGNSELIDFIRTGPNANGEHRISRSVAPFRNTMDSDQLQSMGDQINGGRPSGLKLDTNVSPGQGPKSAGARSQRSAHPRSGVPDSNAAQTVHPAHSGVPQRLSHVPPKSPAAPQPEVLPGRRRYRNKDPYAIDISDDEDDLLTALPKNKRQEESLMDFLNNNEPPIDNAPRPLINGNSAQARSMMNKARANSINSMRSANADASGRTRSMQSTTGPRPGSKAGRPGSSASAARFNDSSTPRPKMEAKSPGDATRDPALRRETYAKESNTRDLADFLKNSGPEDPQSAPAPSVGRQSKLTPKEAAKAQKKVEKDSKGGRRSFFGKAKRTWLDMP